MALTAVGRIVLLGNAVLPQASTEWVGNQYSPRIRAYWTVLKLVTRPDSLLSPVVYRTTRSLDLQVDGRLYCRSFRECDKNAIAPSDNPDLVRGCEFLRLTCSPA